MKSHQKKPEKEKIIWHFYTIST